MTVIPGQITLELLIGNPLIYYGILLAVSALAGLLRGKMESDEAKAGNPEYKGKENITLFDWSEDTGLGFIGGVFGIAILQISIFSSIPTEFIPAFGFAGRIILINWGKKAESISNEAITKTEKTEKIETMPVLSK